MLLGVMAVRNGRIVDFFASLSLVKTLVYAVDCWTALEEQERDGERLSDTERGRKRFRKANIKVLMFSIQSILHSIQEC
jgi:hypothetical protein